MSEELIDRYLDLPALKKETDVLLSYISELEKAKSAFAKSVVSSQIAVNPKDGVAAFNQSTSAQERLTAATQKYDEILKKVNATIKEKNAANRDVLQAQKQYEQSLISSEKVEQQSLKTAKLKNTESERSAKNIDKEDKALEKLNSEYNQLNARQRVAATIAKEMGARFGSTSNEFRIAAERANLLYKELFAIESKLGQSQRNVGNYKSGYDGLSNSINQLTREFPAFGVSVQTGFLALSNNIPIFFDEMKRVNLQLKELRAQGQQAPSMLKSLATSFFSVGTALSLGVTLLTLYGAELFTFIGSLFQSEKAVNRLAESHRNYTQALLDGAKNSAQEVTNLRILEKVATDVTKPMATRLQAVRDMQEEYPSMLGNLSQEALLNGLAAKQINLVADALFKKAFAEAASTKAAEVAGKQLDLELRRNFLLNEQVRITRELATAKAANATDENGVNQAALSAEKHLKELNRLLGINSDQYTFNGKQIDFFTKKAADGYAVIQDLTGKGGVTGVISNLKKEISDLDEAINKETVTAKIPVLVASRKKLQDQLDDLLGKEDKKGPKIKTISDAVADLRKELTGIQGKVDLGHLAPSQADVERVKAFDKAFEDIFKRGGTTDTPIVRQLFFEVKPIDARVLENSIQDFENKLKEANLSPLENYNKNLKEAPAQQKEVFDRLTNDLRSYVNDEAKLYDEISQRELISLQTREANEKAAVTKQFADRGISKIEYENEILRITEKYGRLGLQEQAKWLEREIEILEPHTKAREDAEKKIAELHVLLNKRVLTDDQITFQKRMRLLEDYLIKAQSVANQAIDIIGGAINNGTINQKNAIQEREDDQQKSYENEVARINSLTISDDEKAKRLAVNEASRAAQKQKNERDQRQLDLQRARFEKAANITRIFTETAIAVVHQLATGDPFTAFARAFAVGAIGAAQLAVAIAAPLPKFFRGKNAGDNYEGYGWVDDGGKTEPILREDGTLEISGSTTPRVTYLKRNDIVFPDVEALRNRVAMSQTDKVLANGVFVQQQPSIDLKPLEKKLDGVIHAYNSRPVEQTIWTENGVIRRVQNGNSQTEYINKYVKGL